MTNEFERILVIWEDGSQHSYSKEGKVNYISSNKFIFKNDKYVDDMSKVKPEEIEVEFGSNPIIAIIFCPDSRRLNEDEYDYLVVFSDGENVRSTIDGCVEHNHRQKFVYKEK